MKAIGSSLPGTGVQNSIFTSDPVDTNEPKKSINTQVHTSGQIEKIKMYLQADKTFSKNEIYRYPPIGEITPKINITLNQMKLQCGFCTFESSGFI